MPAKRRSTKRRKTSSRRRTSLPPRDPKTGRFRRRKR